MRRVSVAGRIAMSSVAIRNCTLTVVLEVSTALPQTLYKQNRIRFEGAAWMVSREASDGRVFGIRRSLRACKRMRTRAC